MDLNVSMNLPPEVECQIQGDHSGLAVVAREAVAVDLFRRGILTHPELGRILGIDRFETDALLKRHQVLDKSLSHADVDADLRSIDELTGLPRR